MARHRRGFTLLEVLIALAILSIGVLAAMRALVVVTQSAADLRDRQLAEWVAQNHLAELRALAVFPAIGTREGVAVQAETNFRWLEEVKATPNPLFRRVDVRVFLDGDDHALAQLSGYSVLPLR
jgi:general secretion pathway protein I